MEEFLRQLSSLPQDVASLSHPDIAPEQQSKYSRSILDILDKQDSPSARHSLLQAAAYVPPSKTFEGIALTWAQDPDDVVSGRADVLRYCSSGLADGVFESTPYMRSLAESTTSNARVRDVMLTWSQLNFESFSTACSEYFDEPNLRVAVVRLLIDTLLDTPSEPTDSAASSNMAKMAAHPLMDQLLCSLVFDTDNHLFAIGLRLLLVVIPYAPLVLAAKVPIMMIVMGRAISWRDRPFVDHGASKSQGLTQTPLPRPDLNWQVATSAMTFDLRPPSPLKPQKIAQLYLTALYGAWPSNVIAFTRDPTSYIRGKNVSPMYTVDWDRVWDSGILAARVEPLIRDFRLHPSLVIFTSTAELADNTRWDKIDPSEFIAQSQALANSDHGEVTQVDFLLKDSDKTDAGPPPDDNQFRRENELLRLEARFTSRVRKQYLHHIGRLHRSSLRLNNDEAEIHSFVNRLKEQAKEIGALTAELSQQRTDASQAQQRHLKWQSQLRERVAAFREEKATWQSEAARIRGELGEARSTVKSQEEELALVKNERFKLQSQLLEAEPKIRHISDYETTIKQLTETQRLWDVDVKRCKDSRDEAESWRGKCYELEQQLRAAQNEVASQAQTLGHVERNGVPNVVKVVKQNEPPTSMTRDLTFYSTLLDDAKGRVDRVERENLQLRLELDELRDMSSRSGKRLDEDKNMS